MKPTTFNHCTEVHFTSLLSGGFITTAVINPPEKKLANPTSVHWKNAAVILGHFQKKLADPFLRPLGQRTFEEEF